MASPARWTPAGHGGLPAAPAPRTSEVPSSSPGAPRRRLLFDLDEGGVLRASPAAAALLLPEGGGMGELEELLRPMGVAELRSAAEGCGHPLAGLALLHANMLCEWVGSWGILGRGAPVCVGLGLAIINADVIGGEGPLGVVEVAGVEELLRPMGVGVDGGGGRVRTPISWAGTAARQHNG